MNEKSGTFKVNILELDRAITASQEESLLQMLLNNNVEIEHSCGGNGTCGTCRFELVAGSRSIRNEIEAEFADERGFHKNEYLACQTEISEQTTPAEWTISIHKMD